MFFILLVCFAVSVYGQLGVSSSVPPLGEVEARWNWPVVSHRECVMGSPSGRSAGKGLRRKLFPTFSSNPTDQEFYDYCVDECAKVPWCMAVETKRSLTNLPVFHRCTLVTAVEVFKELDYLDDHEFFLSVRTITENQGSYHPDASINYKDADWEWQGFNNMEVGPLPHTFETWSSDSTEWEDDDVMCIVRGFAGDNLSVFDSEGAGVNTGPAPAGRFTNPPSPEATQPPTQPVASVTPRIAAGIAVGAIIFVTCFGVIFLLGGDDYDKV